MKNTRIITMTLIIMMVLGSFGAIGTSNETEFEDNRDFDDPDEDIKPGSGGFLISFIRGKITDLYEDETKIKFYALGVKADHIFIGWKTKRGSYYWQDETVILMKTYGRFLGNIDNERIFGFYIAFCGEPT